MLKNTKKQILLSLKEHLQKDHIVDVRYFSQ